MLISEEECAIVLPECTLFGNVDLPRDKEFGKNENDNARLVKHKHRPALTLLDAVDAPIAMSLALPSLDCPIRELSVRHNS